MRRLFLATSAVLISCSGRPAGSGSLRVVVTVEPGLRSLCAKVVARGSSERPSESVKLSGRASFTVGVLQEGEPEDVEVQALGFADEGCTTLTAPPERSDSLRSKYGEPTPAVALTLRIDPTATTDGGTGDGGVDADGDGSPVGVDCDDGNPAIHPGATESCTNGVDDDCDRATDCAAASCAGQACHAGPGNVCAASRCTETACNDAQDDDGDGTIDCADADCGGQACGVAGVCTGTMCLATTETGLCFDGIDNDDDGRTDCGDADCPPGAMCSDLNACTQGDLCSGPDAGCGSGAPKTCTLAPPVQCLVTAGVCLPDAGGACSYAVGGDCTDGLACTDDLCAADAGCVGTPKSCATPPGACHSPTGSCSEAMGGLCVYTPLATGTGTCSDGENCTLGDRCDGDGGCSGARVSCQPPNECLTTASSCEVDGGCIFTPRAGACDGGTCAAGACVPAMPVFPYVPSNFTEAELPPTAGAVVINCGVVLNTSATDGGIGWVTCGGGVPPPASRLVTNGGNEAVLLFFDSLTLNSSFTAVGTRPFILAVRGAVTINSSLDVGSGLLASGAGSGAGCPATGLGDPGQAGGTPETAGGGGGGAFKSNAGNGSNGTNGGTQGAGGATNGNTTLVPLRGGCAGGAGGRSGVSGGLKGNGGGAFQLSAGGLITINAPGTIAAGGQGGVGGLADQRVAGGGGGSGGGILLEGTSLTVNGLGAVVANGGAGGEGSGYGGAQWLGVTGQDGQRSTAKALCLSAGACGGNGGQGGAAAGNPTNATNPEACGTNSPGGGGGGSAGRIRFNMTTGCTFDAAAVISPTRTGTPGSCN